MVYLNKMSDVLNFFIAVDQKKIKHEFMGISKATKRILVIKFATSVLAPFLMHQAIFLLVIYL